MYNILLWRLRISQNLDLFFAEQFRFFSSLRCFSFFSAFLFSLCGLSISRVKIFIKLSDVRCSENIQKCRTAENTYKMECVSERNYFPRLVSFQIYIVNTAKSNNNHNSLRLSFSFDLSPLCNKQSDQFPFTAKNFLSFRSKIK